MKISRHTAAPNSSKQIPSLHTRSSINAYRAERKAAKMFGLDHRLYQRPGFLLWRARHIAASIFSNEVGKCGITSPQYLVLAVVQEFPGTDQVSVSRTAGLDRFTTALVLSNLIKRGFIVRERSMSDRRRYCLRLSSGGLGALRRILPGAARARARLMSPFSQSEQRAFIALLRKLVIALNRDARAPVDEDGLPRTRSQPDRIASKMRRKGGGK